MEVKDEVGRCCVCFSRGVEIRYCPVCDAWICEKCKLAFFWRGVAFVRRLIGKDLPCGPGL